MPQQDTKRPNRSLVTTINNDGSHFCVHPADIKGRFVRLRRIVGYALIAFFVGLPWIPINGHPAVFLDIIDRRFHLFGFTLSFQDTWLLFFVVSGLGFSLFYITALFGRVWCGWACPQTVYLEHVYRRIERWIEGDANARRKLDRITISPEKILKRTLKYTIFFLVSFIIAHIFLSYFVSLPLLWRMITLSPAENWTSFLFVFFFTTVLFINFAWFREQLCIVICPYGRFQSALIDDHTKNVAYDYNRGNPPGKRNDPAAGDCIDCHRCVQVCPTGIDIRQGLQLECIGCSACIDACDEIMEKVHTPKGLIRYASDAELKGGKTQWIRFRTISYTILLFIGAIIAFQAFSTLNNTSIAVIRMSGSPYYLTADSVRNQYQVRLTNKTNALIQLKGSITANAEQAFTTNGFERAISLQPMEETLATFVITVPKQSFTGNFPIAVEVTNPEDPTLHLTQTVEFLGPDPKLLNR